MKTRTRTFLPEPFGSGVVPRTIWSPCGGIDAEAEGQLDGLVELRLREFGEDFTASFSGYSLVRSATLTALR